MKKKILNPFGSSCRFVKSEAIAFFQREAARAVSLMGFSLLALSLSLSPSSPLVVFGFNTFFLLGLKFGFDSLCLFLFLFFFLSFLRDGTTIHVYIFGGGCWEDEDRGAR
ncbi:hypothetical protein V8F20_000256 [Naviculisporaceae sp. PSN 640]